jgi:voltage-dependent calcium channel L type alpha-1D
VKKQTTFEKKSFYYFTKDHWLRERAIFIITHRYFDNFILTMIALNSFFLGLSDYEYVDGEGELIANGSWRNTLIEQSEVVFTVVFSIECMLKVFGMGFTGKHSYLKDRWNWLDFVVVITSWLSYVPAIPNVSVLRTFRVLRPLKSISTNPGLQSLVVSILNSIPQLVGVLVLLFFVFCLFGIAGLQMFSGPFMHTRCRLTPYPVNTSWTSDLPYEPYRCLDAPNFDLLEDEDWLKAESPWYNAQDCFWPIDEDDLRMCTLTGQGLHMCHHDTHRIPEEEWRWCGSEFDAKGNARFVDKKTMRAGTHIEELNWGYTNFDNIFIGCITIFQGMTLEGWSDMMFMAQDAVSPYVAAIVFILLVLLGAFFVLNLLLAVLEDNFHHAKIEQKPATPGISILERIVGLICPFEAPLSANMIENRAKLRLFVESQAFVMFIMYLIIANTICLAVDHYPANPEFTNIVDAINFLFSLVFTIEMILKLLALGLLEYLQDTANIFDGVIVILSFVEVIAAPPVVFGGQEEEGGGAITALRSFRLFRIFKLMSKWKSMKKLLVKVIKTVKDLANFGVLLTLFLYIYTLVGMQFFANRLRYDADGYPIEDIGSDEWEDPALWPRSNFDDFNHAFGTVFQVLTTENWNNVMYDCRRSSGGVSIFYICSLIIVGNYIFMNLFLAILLGNFSEADEEEPEPDEEEEDEEGGKDEGKEGDTNGDNDVKKINVKSNSVVPVISQDEVTEKLKNEQEMRLKLKAISKNAEKKTVDNLEEGDDDMGKITSKNNDSIFPLHPSKTLYLFGPDNTFRSMCANLISHPKFDTTILAIIVFSSIVLAVDNPLLNPDSGFAKALLYIDYFLTTLFTVEMLLKIIALGFWMDQGSYLRNSWNVLDFIVVVISIISTFSSSNSDLKALRSLRALRGLRPLRVINRAPGLKVVVNTMFASFPDVVNVFAFCFIFFLIFAIFGVNSLKGNMRSCQGDVFDNIISANKTYLSYLQEPHAYDKLTDTQLEWFGPNSDFGLNCSSYDYPDAPCCAQLPLSGETTSRQVCNCWGGDWKVVMDMGFDNVGDALLTFFQMSTTEGWVKIMYAMVDANGIDMQPIRDNSIVWIYFCIFFMMIGSYLALNLFVGVVIDNFNKMKAQFDGNLAYLTPEQQEWMKTQEIARRLRPQKKRIRPEEAIPGLLFDICFHSWFEWFIMWCIIVNTVIMGMEYFGQSELYGNFLEAVNTVFAMVFTVEAVIKLSALKWKYFDDTWNKFDFAIVLGTNVGLIFLWVAGSNIGMTVTILRTFRIARLLRLMNGTESISQLFNTLLLTLPGLGNIALLLMLLFFIYAVMGIQMFSKTAYNGQYSEHSNFRDFGVAMISLLRFSTGESWEAFMHDGARHLDGCVVDPVYNASYCGFNDQIGCIPLNGCGSMAMFPFMISFTLLITFVFLNLFIGVILEGFQNADESAKAVKPEDFLKFAEHWSTYDPFATCYITIFQLEDFVQTLYAPLGFGEYVASEKELQLRISKLKLHVFSGQRVHFKDVLTALSTEAIKTNAIKKGNEEFSLPTFCDDSSGDHGWGSISRDSDLLPESASKKSKMFTFNSRKKEASESKEVPKQYVTSMEEYYAAQLIAAQINRLHVGLRKRRESTEVEAAAAADSVPPVSSVQPKVVDALISMDNSITDDQELQENFYRENKEDLDDDAGTKPQLQESPLPPPRQSDIVPMEISMASSAPNEEGEQAHSSSSAQNESPRSLRNTEKGLLNSASTPAVHGNSGAENNS